MLAELGLPPDHNDRVATRNFEGYTLGNLSGIDLCNVNLRGANLRKSSAIHSDLRDTDIRGADVTDANFVNVDIFPNQVVGTRNWLRARWPDKIIGDLRLPADHNMRSVTLSSANGNAKRLILPDAFTAA